MTNKPDTTPEFHPVCADAARFVNSFTPEEISEMQTPLMLAASQGNKLANRLLSTFMAIGEVKTYTEADLLGLAFWLSMQQLQEISNDCRNLDAVAKTARDYREAKTAQKKSLTGKRLDEALDMAGYDGDEPVELRVIEGGKQ